MMRKTSGAWILALLSGAGSLQPAGVMGNEACETSTEDALTACKHQAVADFWVAVAGCVQLRDGEERQACKQEARRIRREARGDCDDQFVARDEVCDLLGEAAYDPDIDPDDFVSVVDNPYFPLEPGTTFVYEGQSEQGLEHSEFYVTHNTRRILGVRCVEVHDVVMLNGEVIEDTLDWFAQDKEGNVWYFGENSKELEDGLIVSLEGTWTAGVRLAQPGIIMLAHPQVGDAYRQEFAISVAEDLAEVLSLTEHVDVPYGSFDDCLQTRDFTPLEPDASEHKFYAIGVGNVLTVNVETGERDELVEIRRE